MSWKEVLSRTVPANHDTLAWLVQHAPPTINWHRTGVSFRRVVAPFGRKVMWMATGKDACRIGAESRWRAFFLGLFGAWQRANDYAVGTPDGMEAARAIKLEPDESAWDVLLSSLKGLPWDRNATLRSGSACRGPGRVYIRKNVEIPKYVQTPGCEGRLAITSENNRLISHNSICRKQVESATRDDAVGAERLEESKRWKGEVAPGPNVVMGQSSSSSSGAAGSGEVPAFPGTRRTAEDAGLSSLQDFAEIRRVQSAHGEMMRLGERELSCGTSEVAEVFCPGRRAAKLQLVRDAP